MIEIAPLTIEDLDAIELREEDAREVSPGWKQRALECPRAFCASDSEGRVVAVAGIAMNGVEMGPWLLCSDLVKDHRLTLLRKARGWVQWLRGSGCLVFNYIPKDSTGNRAFIERLGFRILPSPGPGPDFFYLPNV